MSEISYKTSTLAENIVEICEKLQTRLYTLLLRSSFFKFGKKSLIIPPLRLRNSKYISIGEGVIIHNYCWIQALPSVNSTFQPILKLADRCSIGMNATITAGKKVVIEEDVIMGRNVFISDHSHSFKNVNVHIVNQGVCNKREVIVGQGSWLGHGVVVLPGASIGKHCIIGANSVVNSNIPAYSVAVGAPARVKTQYDFTTKAWKKIEL
jgi:acetyltransferase-like isoleucine patch superfamily enzyme